MQRSLVTESEIMSDGRNPLREVAAKVGVAWASIAGVVGALVSFGILNAAQGNAITAAGSALSPVLESLGVVIGGVVPLVGAVIASFHTAKSGENHVTPVDSPRDNDGNALIPAPGPFVQ